MDTNIQQSEPVLKSKIKNTKIIVATVAALLAIVIGVLVYQLIFRMTPKELFFFAEKQSIINISKAIDEMKNTMQYQLAEYMLKNPTHSVVKISGDVSAKGDPYIESQWENITKIIKDSSIIIDSNNDPERKKRHADLMYRFKGVDLLSAQVYNENDTIAFKIPVLFDKYLTFKNEGIREKLEKKGFYDLDIPNKFITNEDIYNAVKLPQQQEIDEILNGYGEFIFNFFKDEEFELERNSTVSASDREIKCSKITLELDEGRIKDLLIEMSDRVKDDKKLHDILIENAYALLELYRESGYIPEDDLAMTMNKSEFSRRFKDDIISFKDAVRELEFKDGLEYSLWVDGMKNIVKRELYFVVNHEGIDDRLYFELANSHWTNKDKSVDTALNIVMHADGGLVEGRNELSMNIEAKDIPAGKNSGNQRKVDISSSLYADDQKEFGINIEIDKKTVDSGEEKEASDVDFRISFEDVERNAFNFEGKLNQQMEGAIASGKINLDSGLVLYASIKDGFSDETANFDINLDVISEMSLGGGLDFPELSDQNSVDIFELDVGETFMMMMNAQRRAQEFLEKNRNILNEMGTEGILQ